MNYFKSFCSEIIPNLQKIMKSKKRTSVTPFTLGHRGQRLITFVFSLTLCGDVELYDAARCALRYMRHT